MNSQGSTVVYRGGLKTRARDKWLAVVAVLALTTASGASVSRTSNASPKSSGSKGGRAASSPAAVSTKVSVPASMRYSPFNIDRYLNIPSGFSISVLARVGGARFMAVAPSGDLLVSQPGSGKVLLVRPNPAGDPSIVEFATG